MILPCDVTGAALCNAPIDGRYTLLGFFNTFLMALLASADLAVITAYRPLEQWWRLASTAMAVGNSVVSNALLPASRLV